MGKSDKVMFGLVTHSFLVSLNRMYHEVDELIFRYTNYNQLSWPVQPLPTSDISMRAYTSENGQEFLKVSWTCDYDNKIFVVIFFYCMLKLVFIMPFH